MGSDRARITYDESRQYRAVVMQQGRVTVEADWNEEEQIINEEIREDALDIIGPNGTPDNGYQVIDNGQAPPLPFDFSVNKGTMYVGGVRASLATDVQYSRQQEWLDHLGDPNWVDPSTLANGQREFIYLYLREQEVSAVEDSALREVALGGPDTGQRLRLIQRIVRLKTDAKDCPTALTTANAKWKTEGLTFKDQTMRLMSSGKLKASFKDPATTPDPCEPVAHGGFLGAENQLIRIQISGFNKATGYKLTWGFDNASFLYRVTVIDNLTLQLLSRPVDDAHNPRPNQQAVEVLRSAAQLSATDFVASATGFVTTLTSYAEDTRRITLPVPLPSEYLDANATPVVFLRVWEEEKPFTAGTPVVLGETGLQVTLTADGGLFHIGDYWLIAVRPNTPTEVYPQRYLKEQPPDGPRLWACPLKVIEWNNDGTLKTLDDCRNLFNNLVELTKRKNGGCCNVTVRPEDLTDTITLNTIIAHTIKDREQATVCLTPGDYSLSEPLRLGPDHSNLTLESCHDGVVIQAAAGHEDKFLDGLIILTGTPVQLVDNVTLRGLQFKLPLTPLIQAGGTIANIESSILKQMVGPLIQETISSIGVRTQDCTRLTIKDCRFQFSTKSDRDIVGWGIKAGGQCLGLTVQGNTFVREGDIQQPGESPFRIFVGYELSSSIQFAPGVSAASTAETIPAGTTVRARLQDASFQDNLFTNIWSAVNINADNAGTVKIERNTVRDCVGDGFSLSSDVSSAIATLVDEVSVNKEQITLAQRLRTSILSRELDPARQIEWLFARGYPLPRGFDMSHAIQVDTQKASTAAEVGRARMQTFFDKTLSAGPGDAAEKVNVKEGATKPTETTFPGRMGGLKALHLLLSAFERVALLQDESLAGAHLSLRVSDNDISTTIPAHLASSALNVTDFSQKDIEINMSANTVQDQSGANTVRILGLGVGAVFSTITGNQISNTNPSGSGGALEFSGQGGINMGSNTVQSQGIDPTVTINAGPERAMLIGNQISNNSSISGIGGIALQAFREIVMSDNTVQSQADGTTVTIIAGPAGAMLTGNQISNSSRIGVGSALVVAAARILMSSNTVQSQADRPGGGPTVSISGPTVDINSGTIGATLTGNLISNNSLLGNSALVVSAGIFFAGIFMTANTIQNQSTSDPTVLIAHGIANSTITGNGIFNLGGNNRLSLAYTDVDGVVATITGNILKGLARLPNRFPTTPPPPLNTWEFFNTLLG